MPAIKGRTNGGPYGDISACRRFGNFDFSEFHRPERYYRPEVSSLNLGRDVSTPSGVQVVKQSLNGCRGPRVGKPRFTRRIEVMKLQNIVTTKVIIQPNVVEKERSKDAPTPAEIRLRAFEVHIERGGIHRLALDTSDQTDANFKKSSTTKKTQQRYEMRYPNNIEIRERSATVKSPSLLGWYHILRAQHHWTVFQAIRYALWLLR
jgi:hypothetical protein